MPDDETVITKIKDLHEGIFTVLVKVIFSTTGSADKKYLQRGRLADETGAIDFVVFRDAQLEPLEDGKIYKITRAYASDNKGVLTLRPNKRKDNCKIILIEVEMETSSSTIFRDRASIPSVLKDETRSACSIIFDHIINQKSSPDLSDQDKAERLSILHDALIVKYQNGEAISYESEEYQNAYMFGYFPFYIGMIYHILRITEFERPSEIFKNNLNICLYGCGPSPELLGITGYLRDFHKEVRRINVTFLDHNSWDFWRSFCLKELLPLYWDGEINVKSFPFDLLQFREDERAVEAISSATIHNIQNLISDLFKIPETLEKMEEPFFELYKNTYSGSIMILSDQYYGETSRIFERISSIASTHKLGSTILKPDMIYIHKREFETPQMMMDIGHHYKKDIGFFPMVLQKS